MDRLTSMEALVRVVDSGSFSAAARQWGRSKAAVSKYVAALEEHLGLQLLQRTTRSSSLTEAGRLYVAGCREVLGEIDSLETSLRGDRAALSGLLRVTAPPGLAARYLSALTSDFIDQHPNITIELDLTHRIVDLVDEGIDVAIRATEPRDSTLIARNIAPVRIVAVASPAYLARHGAPADPRDLRGHRCLVDTNFRDQQRWRFRVDGAPLTVRVAPAIRVNSPVAIRDLAIAGHGIALVPDFLVADALADGTLVELLLGMVAIAWSVHAVYPRRRHVPARLRAYVDHLARSLAPMATGPRS
jgi:DNA-binding transcriptional LysR family regulator